MGGHTNDDIIYLIEDETPKSRISVLWLILFIGIALCFLSFATVYHFRYSRPPFIDYSPVCTGIADLDKFDCHPDDNASEHSCLQRNCCYQPKAKNFPPLNIPYCYYPSNYNGYVIGNISQDGRYIRADLNRSSPSGFPKDIVNLQLVISFIDDYTLRIKITDAKAARFEVPIPINDALKNLEKPYYDVKIDSKTGELIISRKLSGVVIFKTSLSQLVYSDQFLQITSKLPSPYIYGIGEHYGSFLKSVNWTRLTLLNSDRGPLANYPLYGSHPFYLSLENDGSANGVFLLNSNAMVSEKTNADEQWSVVRYMILLALMHESQHYPAEKCSFSS
ncbi:lysosomal alpha-glucosidase [Trichonephila clavipes]|nr:lysosomal alpha-glucosidase [Trichonephila clavipes]